MKPTRGERNNNPGNIRESRFDGVHWQGERATDDDPAFEEFNAPEDGIRALGRVLLSYYRKHHLNTVNDIIHRWAPPNENDTISYVFGVAKRMSIDPHMALDLERAETLQSLVEAIIIHENGRCIYTPGVVAAGVTRALA